MQYVDVITNPENYFDTEDNPRSKRMKTAMGSQKVRAPPPPHRPPLVQTCPDLHYAGATCGTRRPSQWLDLQQHSSTPECIGRLKEDGWRILATDLSPGAVPIEEVDWSQPFVVVLGNEERGITEDMRGLADQCFYVPMKGFAQSFSLSVSCAVIGSHLSSRGAVREGTLPESEVDRLLFRWLLQSIKGGRYGNGRCGLCLVPS